MFRTVLKLFRRDQRARRGGGIRVTNYLSCSELWVDEGFEMIAVEVK